MGAGLYIIIHEAFWQQPWKRYQPPVASSREKSQLSEQLLLKDCCWSSGGEKKCQNFKKNNISTWEAFVLRRCKCSSDQVFEKWVKRGKSNSSCSTREVFASPWLRIMKTEKQSKVIWKTKIKQRQKTGRKCLHTPDRLLIFNPDFLLIFQGIFFFCIQTPAQQRLSVWSVCAVLQVAVRVYCGQDSSNLHAPSDEQSVAPLSNKESSFIVPVFVLLYACSSKCIQWPLCKAVISIPIWLFKHVPW